MLAAGQHRAFLRFDRDDAQRGLARFEDLSDAGDGAAGADAGNEVVDVAAGVVPDFLRRGAAVNFGIGEVLELLRHYRIGGRAHQLLGGRDRALHALGRRRQDDFGAEERQHLAPFDRHRFRHYELQPVTPRRRHERERDAGISRGRLDQHGVGVDVSRLLHRDHHRSPDAVLHARGGCEIFELGKNGRVRTMRLRQFAQAHDRRVTDRIHDRVEDPATAGTVHCTRSWRRIHDELLCGCEVCEISGSSSLGTAHADAQVRNARGEDSLHCKTFNATK